jgi:predicted Rossmann fold nucleotide-binding protein DprA/Smf involved in DNA uptake
MTIETATEYAWKEAGDRYSRELDEYRKAYERQLMNAKDISTAAFGVGVAILFYEGYPTDVGRIAKEVRITPQQVMRAIKWLERRGHIKRLSGPSHPHYFANVWDRAPPGCPGSYVELPTAIH